MKSATIHFGSSVNVHLDRGLSTIHSSAPGEEIVDDVVPDRSAPGHAMAKFPERTPARVRFSH